jgi:hypothetical protein
VSGQSFGTNEETGTAWGPFAALGVELGLGPGALLGELQFSYGGFNGYALRDTNLGSLGVMLGYRLMFPRASHDAAPSAREEAAELAIDDVPPPQPSEPASAEPAAAPEPSAADAEPEATAAPVAAPAAQEQGSAQVRGNIRGFSGEPLHATIRLKPRDLKASTDDEGHFELDLPPGDYTVRIRAFGYVSQSRRIVVEPNGVTVLNVELGKK